MKRRYIIFADNDADDLQQVTGFFRHFNPNIDVLEFHNGKEVLKFLDEFSNSDASPALIVLEVDMPLMNGRETLAAIRNSPRYQYTPVVMYTASTSPIDETFCNRLGASWVNKPSEAEGIRQVAKVLAEFCELQVF